MFATLENSILCLERCTSLRKLKQIYAQVFINGLQDKNYVAVKLVSCCSKTLGSIDFARKIFDNTIRSANVFLWTAMISSYSNNQSSFVSEAIWLFKSMHHHGVKPNDFTLSSVLKACSSLMAVHEGKQIHAFPTKLGLNSSTFVLTTLLDMYAKFGFIQESRYLYDTFPEKNVVTCNSMIACYSRAGELEAARRVFDQMSHRDSISWSIMISGYASSGNSVAAREFFEQMPVKETNCWNALILGYSQSGQWNKSIQVMYEMLLQHMKPNHFTMAMVMTACGQLGTLRVARQLHGFLHKNCIEMNAFVCNSLVDMYARCGSIHEAYLVFKELPVKDVVSYNVMISGFASHGSGEDALQLFYKMLEEGIQPDMVSFLGILSACSQSGHPELGQYYLDRMRSDYAVECTVDHYACMVDLLGRAGFVERAYDLVKTMSMKPHAGVWGALLNASRMYCNVEIGEIAACELFKIEPANPGNYVILSNIYARAHLWDGVKRVRCLMREKGVAKMAGLSMIEVNDGVHKFSMGVASHTLSNEIYYVLENLSLELG